MKTRFLWLLIALSACSLEKDVDIELPDYAPELVVEAYLEAGEPFRVLLSESSVYTDGIAPTLINDATIVLTHGGVVDTIPFRPSFDSTFFKAYNYQSTSPVPADFSQLFSLRIEDGNGRVVTGVTRLNPPVILDTVRWVFREDSLAYLVALFQDPGDTPNFYRFVINRDSLNTAATVEYTASDEGLNGGQVALGTGFDFEVGDTVFVRLFNLDERYYNFLNSLEEAQDANGNPFAQPAPIRSGVDGGIGTFTSLSYDQRMLIIR